LPNVGGLFHGAVRPRRPLPGPRFLLFDRPPLTPNPPARAPPPPLRAPPSPHTPICSNFFFAHYNQVKTLAPNFAFQIRHTSEEPYMMVEYDFGETAKVGLGGLKDADIRRKVRAPAALFLFFCGPARARRGAPPHPRPPSPAQAQLEQAIYEIGPAMPQKPGQREMLDEHVNILPAVVE
jgi:hypothetical protein